MRRATVLLASIFLVAVGVVAIGPAKVEAATVKSCTGGEVKISDKEKRMLRLHNQKRADKGLPRLCVHPKLQKAANAHSKDMIRRDYFSHNTKGRNENACERMQRYGYNWSACGENIALGSGAAGSPKQIFQSGPDNWMDSKYHRKNILDRRFREVGIGAHRGNYKGHSGVTMWTVDFGDR